MKHTLILTQKQLDEVCGGNSMYLDKLISTPDLPENGGNLYITPNGWMDDDYADPVTTDDISRQLPRDQGILGTRGYARTISRMCAETKGEWKKRNLVNETNQELDNVNMTAVLGSGDDKETVTGNEAMLAMKKTRAKQAGNHQAEKQLQTALDKKRNVIRQRKENLKNIGVANQFQKAGGSKNSGNGKAHTPKLYQSGNDDMLDIYNE